MSMRGDSRSLILRYGLAILIFIALLVLSAILRANSIQLNLTIAITIALVAASWFGGRGPGILLLSLILLASAILSVRSASDNTSTGSLIFAFVTGTVVLGLLVLLVSGRRSTEKRLKEQGELLRTTLSCIGDAVIATDANGKITFFNPTAERITGCISKEAIGKHLSEIYNVIDEMTGESVGNIFEMIKADRKVVTFNTNVSIRCSDEVLLPIIDSGAPIVDQNDSFIGTVIVFQDDSARREAERAQLELESRQQQSQKLEAIGTLTGGVAHDFNNLLTAILGYTQLAMRKLEPNAPAFDNLTNVEKAGNRAADLTKKLLAFSRRQKLESRVIDLNGSIEEILKLLERVIGASIEVKFHPAADLSRVNADPTQIEQVIMNLSLNARDAMPNGGRLVIETRNVELDEYYCRQYPGCEPGRYAQILVSDTGAGMDQATLNRIFEPFFTTKDVDKGTGLGLSMVYGIVKQHKGHINVYSEPGKGTSFKVFFPIVADLAQTNGHVERPKLTGGKETILIADDEEALRNLSTEVLETLGYRVLAAENGERAIELYKENRDEIDLLLLDVVMPQAGGVEAYKAISEFEGSVVPVIFMTGYSSEVFDHSKGEMGIDAAPVIQKPYTLDAIGRMVRETLDRR